MEAVMAREIDLTARLEASLRELNNPERPTCEACGQPVFSFNHVEHGGQHWHRCCRTSDGMGNGIWRIDGGGADDLVLSADRYERLVKLSVGRMYVWIDAADIGCVRDALHEAQIEIDAYTAQRCDEEDD